LEILVIAAQIVRYTGVAIPNGIEVKRERKISAAPAVITI